MVWLIHKILKRFSTDRTWVRWNAWRAQPRRRVRRKNKIEGLQEEVRALRHRNNDLLLSLSKVQANLADVKIHLDAARQLHNASRRSLATEQHFSANRPWSINKTFTN